MKARRALEFIVKLQKRPELKRKLKVIAAVGFIGVVVTVALTIWAGLAAFRLVAEKMSVATSSPTLVTQVEDLKKVVSGDAKLQPANCWEQAQKMMAIQPWMDRPMVENFLTLKSACVTKEAI